MEVWSFDTTYHLSIIKTTLLSYFWSPLTFLVGGDASSSGLGCLETPFHFGSMLENHMEKLYGAS